LEKTNKPLQSQLLENKPISTRKTAHIKAFVCVSWMFSKKLTLTTAPRRWLTAERETVSYQYRAAPGTAMIGNRDNDTPAQSQLAGNEGSSERTSEGLKYP